MCLSASCCSKSTSHILPPGESSNCQHQAFYLNTRPCDLWYHAQEQLNANKLNMGLSRLLYARAISYRVSRFSLEFAVMPGYLAVLCATSASTSISNHFAIPRGVCRGAQRYVLRDLNHFATFDLHCACSPLPAWSRPHSPSQQSILGKYVTEHPARCRPGSLIVHAVRALIGSTAWASGLSTQRRAGSASAVHGAEKIPLAVALLCWHRSVRNSSPPRRGR